MGYYVQSNGKRQTSRLVQIESDYPNKFGLIYVGASSNTSRDLRDEYAACRDKHNLYISTWTDQYAYTKTLVEKLAECINGKYSLEVSKGV